MEYKLCINRYLQNGLHLLYIYVSTVVLQDRVAVRHEITLYKLSINKDIVDPYYNEEILRRQKRQTAVVSFPSDDEDTSAADGSGVEADDPLTSTDIPSVSTTTSTTRSDWGKKVFLIK